jgi:hypothetical protein
MPAIKRCVAIAGLSLIGIERSQTLNMPYCENVGGMELGSGWLKSATGLRSETRERKPKMRRKCAYCREQIEEHYREHWCCPLCYKEDRDRFLEDRRDARRDERHDQE